MTKLFQCLRWLEHFTLDLTPYKWTQSCQDASITRSCDDFKMLTLAQPTPSGSSHRKNFTGNSALKHQLFPILHIGNYIYSFAVDFVSCLARWTRIQASLPIGCLISAWCFAFSLLACLTAYRAAIPWQIQVVLKNPNASPNVRSGLGSHPATSAYHSISWFWVGRPGVAPSRNAILFGASVWLARLYGVIKLMRSDRGWPMVDISQLSHSQRVVFLSLEEDLL